MLAGGMLTVGLMGSIEWKRLESLREGSWGNSSYNLIATHVKRRRKVRKEKLILHVMCTRKHTGRGT